MAFVLSPPLLPSAPSSSKCHQRSLFRMTSTPPSGTEKPVESTTPSYQLESNGYELDTEAIQKRAMDFMSDIGTRPLFYGKLLGYGVGALVGFTVLKAIVTAVDSIPVLPGALELIGLGYTTWFVWRYVLFKESREELLEEIEEFLGKAKP